jgi:hypothetical protein
VKKSARMAPDRMISGKLRNKAARHGAEHKRLAVDGVEYAWSYRHGWLVWGKGIKAISLSVSLHPGRTRELVLDLSLKVDDQDAPPPERRVLAALEGGIRSAVEAGWDPESRGRAFRYEISEAV